MDVEIGKGFNLRIDGRDTGGGLATTEDTEATSLTAALEAAAIYVGNDAAEIDLSNPSPGKSQALSNIQGSLRVKNEAMAEILRLREEQLELVLEAEESAYGGRAETIEDTAEDLSAEIDYIRANATYNGKSVINEYQNFSYEEYSYSDDGTVIKKSASISVGPIDTASPQGAKALNAVLPLGSLPSVRIDQENAQDSEDFLDQTISTYRSFKAGLEAAENKADKLDDPPPSNPLEDSGGLSPATIVDAQELARRIANSISSPYAQASQSLALIDSIAGSLDEERVSKLLEEA